MATCAVAVQQSDGSYTLTLAPSITDVSTCAYVVQSGADVANSLLMMSAEDGALVSVGMVSTWAAAWGILQVARVIRGGSTNEAA